MIKKREPAIISAIMDKMKKEKEGTHNRNRQC